MSARRRVTYRLKTAIVLDMQNPPTQELMPETVAWETCAGCGRDYAWPHLCRRHLLCGLCHPEATDAEPIR